jgi:hypothetical protein
MRTKQRGPSAAALMASFNQRRCAVCGWIEVCAVCPGSDDPPTPDVALCLSHATAFWNGDARYGCA